MSLFRPVPVRLALASLLAPGLLLVPALTSAATAAEPPAPQPVAASVQELPVEGVDPAARNAVQDEGSGSAPALEVGGTTRRTVLLTPQRSTAPYSLVGVTWTADPAVGPVQAWARTRTAGVWADWSLIGAAADEEPDAGTPDVARTPRDGTAPLWTGAADGVQVRVDLLSGQQPRDLRVALVDPGASPADAAVAEGSFSTPASLTTGARPAIHSRADWGADESLRTGAPTYAPRVTAIVVHHTASPNGYTPAQVPSLLRGFYAYHVQSRGWSDIGYNVLVDRFGTAWEGRAGGLDRAVIGAHAGGFNTGTAGLSMIGTYEDLAPSAATLETVARVAAWKLGGVDALSSQQLTSGGSTRFSAGSVVTLPTVMGHRQVSTTSCPGALGYAAMPGLRQRIAALQGGAAPYEGVLQLVAPSSVKAGGTADVLVRGGRAGAPLEVFFAQRGDSVATKRRDGTFGADGTYRTSFPVEDDWTVFAASDGVATARSTVRRSPALTADPGTSTPGVTVQGPLTVARGGTAVVTALGPPGADVSVWFRPEGQDVFTRRRAGALDKNGSYTTSYTADVPMEYYARTAITASTTSSTAIGPVPDGLSVSAPEAVASGGTVPVVVQGTPGAAVALWFARHGEQAFTRRREGVLGADGTFRTSYVGADDHTVFATSGTRSSAWTLTRVTGSPTVVAPAEPRVLLAAPETVDVRSQATVVVTGPARSAAELWARRRGEPVFTQVRTGTLDGDGRWETGFAATDDHELWAAAGALGSRSAATVVRPVLSGPASAPLGSRVVLSGFARPGDSVVVESRRRGSAEVSGSTVVADGSGAFTTSVALTDEYEYRASAAGRDGALRRTTVAPTMSAPTTAARGSAVTLTGTARPGAQVQVYFNGSGASVTLAGRKPRDLPLFRLGRTLTADAAGRWSTSFLLGRRYETRAVADGSAAPVRTTTPR